MRILWHIGSTTSVQYDLHLDWWSQYQTWPSWAAITAMHRLLTEFTSLLICKLLMRIKLWVTASLNWTVVRDYACIWSSCLWMLPNKCLAGFESGERPGWGIRLVLFCLKNTCHCSLHHLTSARDHSCRCRQCDRVKTGLRQGQGRRRQWRPDIPNLHRTVLVSRHLPVCSKWCCA